MNRKFQSLLKQQWTNRLLALFMCASLLLSSVAARPLAQSYDQAPPTPTSAPAVDTATPEPAAPAQDQSTPTDVAATPTDAAATPTDAAATPTDVPAAPTDVAATPTEEQASPTVEAATPTAEPAAPTPTEAAPTQAPTAPVEQSAQSAASPKEIAGLNYHQLVIKFKGGYVSSLKDQSLSAQSLPGVAPLLDLLKGAPIKPFFNSLNQASGVLAASQSESVLSRYYFAQLPDSTDFAGAQQVLDSVKALPFIDTAYMEPIYKPASTTPDFFALGDQNYLFAAGSPKNGIGATCDPLDCAWEMEPNYGKGLGVRVYDVELGWQIGHEDLPVNKSYLLDSANTSQQDWVDHGTAVLGVIGASHPNGVGVIGIAPKSELWMVSSLQDADLSPRSLADAINLATVTGRPGDIIVIPLEMLGPPSSEIANCSDADNASFEDIPVEYTQANYDAISAATTAGLVVVEAAGNGQMNLSADRYHDLFDRGSRDSGAILVGAGTSDTRSPVCSTNFGSRVDLQGWGENVTTTGYGDLQNLGDPNSLYTQEFGGTSAAAAMVAGAAADFQGIAKHRGYSLSPEEVREALQNTGTAQGPSTTHHIGPLPNLVSAINKKIPDTVQLLTPPDSGPDLNTLRPTLDWASFNNASEYELQVGQNGTSTLIVDTTTTGSIYTFTTNLSPGLNYYWRVKAMVNSVWFAYSEWFQFRISQNIITVPATTLVSPDSGTVFNHPADNPTFVWNKTTSTKVTDYEIQISTASDFSAGPGILDDPVNPSDGSTHSYSLTKLAPNTLYYWRVRCVISGTPDNDSSWTSSRIIYTSLNRVSSFNASPNNLPVNSLRPLFTWTAVSGAKAYSLQVSTSASFSSSYVVFSATINIASGAATPHNYYQMQSDLPHGKILYWHVRDQGKYGWSAYNAALFSFTTGNPPGVPSLSQPASNADVTDPGYVVMKWSTPIGAKKFWLQVSFRSDFSNFTNGVNVIGVTNPYTASLAPNTKYYWRVRAGDILPTWSAWSSAQIFYTTPHDPTGLVSLPSPTNSLTPTFGWTSSLESSSYRIEVLKFTTTCTTTVVLDTTITSSPPYTLTSVLPRNSSLCWRLSAGGLYGFSHWVTNTNKFTTNDPPYPPTLSSPGNGAALATFAPLLAWNSSPYQSTQYPSRAVNQYEVQYSSSKSFTSPIDILVNANKPNKYQIGATDLVNAGTYYWRVRALNTGDSTFSIWSSTWSFITPPQMQGTIYDALTVNPTATPPYPGDTVQSVNLQISGTSWATTTDSSGAYNFRGLPPGTYDLLISKGNYIRQTRKISISRGNNIEQDFDIVPIPSNTTKPYPVVIQLTWDSTVANMDANLWLPKITGHCLVNKIAGHLDTSDSCGLDPTVTHAFLTADDDQIYGTEVITIDAFSNATDADPYVFAVLLNDAASKMAGSGAKVTVYEGSVLEGTFSVPPSSSGIWWKVFTLTLNATSVTIDKVNTVGSTSPVP